MNFKLNKLTKMSGIAQIPLIIGLLLMAVAIPIATKLSQENQNPENRAATCVDNTSTTFQCSSNSCCTGFRKVDINGTLCRCERVTTPTNTPRPCTCTPNSVRCNGSSIEQCNSNCYGWSIITTCPGGCSSGACNSIPTAVPPTSVPPTTRPCICTRGSVRCSGSSIEQCNNDCYGWSIITTCPGGCSNGACSSIPTAVPPTSRPPTATPAPTCDGTCMPSINLCSYYSLQNGTGTCASGSRCCRPLPTATPAGGLPTPAPEHELSMNNEFDSLVSLIGRDVLSLFSPKGVHAQDALRWQTIQRACETRTLTTVSGRCNYDLLNVGWRSMSCSNLVSLCGRMPTPSGGIYPTLIPTARPSLYITPMPTVAPGGSCNNHGGYACIGKNVYQCSGFSKWEFYESCSNFCTNGVCNKCTVYGDKWYNVGQGVCNADGVRIQTCQSNGGWSQWTTCLPGSCKNGSCVSATPVPDCIKVGSICVVGGYTNCQNCCGNQYHYVIPKIGTPYYVCGAQPIPTSTPTPIPTRSTCDSTCVPSINLCSYYSLENGVGTCGYGLRCCKPKSGTPTKITTPTTIVNPVCPKGVCNPNCNVNTEVQSGWCSELSGIRCCVPFATATASACISGSATFMCSSSTKCCGGWEKIDLNGYLCGCKRTTTLPSPTLPPYNPNPTSITTPMPTLQPGQACRVDTDCGSPTKSGCAVQCVTDYCPGNSGCGKTEGSAGVLNCQLYPPTGTKWNAGYSACVTDGTVPTGGPPPPPTNPPGPPPATCNYTSLQARVQRDSSQDWQTQLTVKRGDKVNLGCMSNGSGQLANNVKIVAQKAGEAETTFNTNLKNEWIAPETGSYSVWCQSTDSNCAGLVSNSNATLVVGGMCKECPNDFHCYGPADDKTELGYSWFATGYVMEGWVAQVPDNYCSESGLTKPQWLGKGMGDANCDGQINTYDFSLWNKEFVESGSQELVRDDWEADFTGPDGKCDGLVNTYDFSLWNRSFIQLGGGN